MATYLLASDLSVNARRVVVVGGLAFLQGILVGLAQAVVLLASHKWDRMGFRGHGRGGGVDEAARKLGKCDAGSFRGAVRLYGIGDRWWVDVYGTASPPTR